MTHKEDKNERYEVLVPCVMRKNVFTILAKDNIDLNARSTDAKSHYHSTSLSGLQYPNQENLGSMLQRTFENLPTVSKKLESLPKKYSEVPELPSNHKSDISAPVCTVNLPSYMETLSSLIESIQFEYEWLKTVKAGVYGQNNILPSKDLELKSVLVSMPFSL